MTLQADTSPDSVLRPQAEIVTQAEIRTQLGRPVNQYALIENALRAAEQQDLAEHRRDVAELWAGFSQVAARNPDAWLGKLHTPAEIGEPGPGNRMLAFPYTKRLVSQWNVDQAAGLVLCSLGTARSLGLPAARRVYPLAVADCEHMVPLTRRRQLHRSPGFRLAGRRALSSAGCELSELTRLELYSCFPAAVRVQQRELEVPAERELSVTGGMTFGGGPLNNFVLQAWVRTAQLLRSDGGGSGLVTAVSGIITKQGVSVFSTEPAAAFVFDDVSAEARAAADPELEVLESAEGSARVASYTVLYDDERPARAILLCDLEDGQRALTIAEDPELAERATREELCGSQLRLSADGSVALG